VKSFEAPGVSFCADWPGPLQLFGATTRGIARGEVNSVLSDPVANAGKS
jgi:hypothetical protein